MKEKHFKRFPLKHLPFEYKVIFVLTSMQTERRAEIKVVSTCSGEDVGVMAFICMHASLLMLYGFFLVHVNLGEHFILRMCFSLM